MRYVQKFEQVGLDDYVYSGESSEMYSTLAKLLDLNKLLVQTNSEIRFGPIKQVDGTYLTDKNLFAIGKYILSNEETEENPLTLRTAILELEKQEINNVGPCFNDVLNYAKTGDAIDLFKLDKLAGRYGSNGGQRCDVEVGPCSCGAWHKKSEGKKALW